LKEEGFSVWRDDQTLRSLLFSGGRPVSGWCCSSFAGDFSVKEASGELDSVAIVLGFDGFLIDWFFDKKFWTLLNTLKRRSNIIHALSLL